MATTKYNYICETYDHHSNAPLCPRTHAGHVSADSDSAEDIAEDPDAAVDDEEDDEDEVLVEEDQIQPTEIGRAHV